MTRVGLVLGGGGAVGQAHHAGVLAALEHDLGWDPRTADVIVGTSVGSITGTLLRHGVPASDLAAWSVRAPLSTPSTVVADLFGEDRPRFVPFRARDLVRRLPSLPGRHMAQHALLQPWHFRPMTAAFASLAPGRHDITEQVTALAGLEGRPWPDEQFWVPAVRRRDGRRVVFGRPGTSQVPLHQAVAASCAVPGYFAPVTVADRRFVDGGIHSPTNADVLLNEHLDVVIIVSPMSGPSGLPRDPYGVTRWHAGRLVNREVKRLRAQGSTVVVFEPDQHQQRLMGNDLMASERVADISTASFFAAGASAATPQIRNALAGLSSPKRPR